MTLSWTTLFLLCLAGASVWFWQNSLAARELANQAAMDACERLALQFLDGTVAFARIQVGRGRSGRLVLRRTYVFDYTANSIERRQGFIVIGEGGVEAVGYEQEEHSRLKTAEKPIEPTQVIQLNEWRKPVEPPRPGADPSDKHRTGDDPYRARQPPE
jgi:hypothetical protein